MTFPGLVSFVSSDNAKIAFYYQLTLLEILSMNWTVYLSGEIHSDWRDQILAGVKENNLPIQAMECSIRSGLLRGTW